MLKKFLYEYKARDIKKGILTGTLKASSEKDAILFLHNRSLIILSLVSLGEYREEAHNKTAQNSVKSSSTKLSSVVKNKKTSPSAKKKVTSFNATKDITRKKATSILDIEIGPPKQIEAKSKQFFFEQMALLISTGIDIVRALDIIGNHDLKKPLNTIVFEMKQMIRAGSTLSKSMESFKHLGFSDTDINFALMGEQNSRLPEIFNKLALAIKESVELEKTLRKALTYPCFLLCVAFGVVVFFLVKIIPSLKSFFKKGVSLPLPTKILLNISYVLQHYYLALLIVIIVIIITAFFMWNTPRYKIIFDQFILKIPLLGSILVYSKVEYFSSSLSMMLFSGVPIVDAMGLLGSGYGSLYYEKINKKIIENIRSGQTLSLCLAPYESAFPSIVSQFISIGEETGALGDMLDKLAMYSRKYVKTRVETFSAMIEPIIMLGMGFVVGFIVLAMFLPIFRATMSI